MSSENKPKVNPFLHRWKLDDPQWLKQRKRQWAEKKEILKKDGISTEEIKYFKDFFVEGKEPPQYRKNTDKYELVAFTAAHRLAFTPCDTVEEVREVFDSIEPFNYRFALGLAFGGRDGLAGAQQEIISKALYPPEYKEETVKLHRKEYKKYDPAEEVLKIFEGASYRILTESINKSVSPLQYIITHYISCVRHLENTGDVEHHVWFPNLISCIFNFVEPRASWGQDSDARLFADTLKKHFQEADVPHSIKQEIDNLAPNYIIEYPKSDPPKSPPRIDNIDLCTDWSAPLPRVLHQSNIPDSISVFIKSTIRVNLLPNDFRNINVEFVNIATLVSDEFIEYIGYDRGGDVPARRITVWFVPEQPISNDPSARFGTDLFVLSPKITNQESGIPALIYYPRLSEYYRFWYPSEVLILKERQLRRDVFSQTGQYLVEYTEDKWLDNVEDNFIQSPYLITGFDFIRDYKSGSTELAIEGPDVLPWECDPHLPLDLNDLLKDE